MPTTLAYILHNIPHEKVLEKAKQIPICQSQEHFLRPDKDDLTKRQLFEIIFPLRTRFANQYHDVMAGLP